MTDLARLQKLIDEWTFGDGRPRAEEYEHPGSAADAVAWLECAQEAFAKDVRSLQAADVDDPRPTHYATKRSIADLVWDIAVEHLHHGAEIGLLRDLIRGHARDDRFPGPWT